MPGTRLLAQRRRLLPRRGPRDEHVMAAANSYSAPVDLASFGNSGRDERFELFPAYSGFAQSPLLDETEAGYDPETLNEHWEQRAPPPVSIYSLANYECWSVGLLLRAHEPFLADDVYPEYIDPRFDLLPEVWAGSLREPAPREIRADAPVSAVLHPNLVYGHFLLEMLPRIYLMGVLRDLGLQFGILQPSALPGWVTAFLDLLVPDSNRILYDAKRDFIRAPAIIAPSMMHRRYAYHPAFNLLVAAMLRRCGVPLAGPPPNRRIYVSRTRNRPGWHVMTNEAEIERAMSDAGLEIIHPQELDLGEQIKVFSQAALIVGQYSSALHNALFAPAGATVIALNRVNWYQSMIARLRRHRLAFIKPRDGVFRNWRLRARGDAAFAIDPQEVARVLRLAGQS
jgi:O-antigen biosynthesis protein WbqL